MAMLLPGETPAPAAPPPPPRCVANANGCAVLRWRGSAVLILRMLVDVSWVCCTDIAYALGRIVAVRSRMRGTELAYGGAKRGQRAAHRRSDCCGRRRHHCDGTVPAMSLGVTAAGFGVVTGRLYSKPKSSA
eukprot:3193165-Rhodomonas_salina.1